MGTHPYKVDGKRVPGVTTVIGRFKESGGLIHWAWQLGKDGKNYRDERDKAANAGTVAHDLIEHDIHGRSTEGMYQEIDPDVVERARQGFAAYKTWADGVRLQIVDTEMPLVSEKYKFGGCPDGIGFVGDDKTALAVLDWKTSNKLYPDHLIQVAAYAHLWDENHPERPITGGVHICRFSKDYADFEHRYFTDTSDAWRLFLLYRQAYDLAAVLKKRV